MADTTSTSLRQMPVEEFVRRLADRCQQPDIRFALFLGAGCSVSSGIPAAGSLVGQWLRQLRRYRPVGPSGFDDWAKHHFPNYDPASPAIVYADVMLEAFPDPADRQAEIERLCDGKIPGFGYISLAQLIAGRGKVLEQIGTSKAIFSTVLTPNFDDLIADALYLTS